MLLVFIIELNIFTKLPSDLIYYGGIIEHISNMRKLKTTLSIECMGTQIFILKSIFLNKCLQSEHPHKYRYNTD